jgi:hypothetical protein
MQISTIKNQNLEKPSRNTFNRTIVKILGKKFFGYISEKIWFRVCSVTAKMFELRNSGENRRKLNEFFSKIYQGHTRIWFRPKKILKYLMLVYLYKIQKIPRLWPCLTNSIFCWRIRCQDPCLEKGLHSSNNLPYVNSSASSVEQVLGVYDKFRSLFALTLKLSALGLYSHPPPPTPLPRRNENQRGGPVDKYFISRKKSFLFGG